MYDRQMNFGTGLSLHPQHAELIGAIVARWNTIERACGQLLFLFAGANPRQGILLLGAVQGAKNRIELVRTAGEYHLRQSKRLPEFKAILKRLQQASQKRNDYAHGLYAVNDYGHLLRLTARQDWVTMDPLPEPLLLQTLKDDLKEFDDVLVSVISFHSTLWRETNPELRDALQKSWELRGLPDQGDGEPQR